jgi:hypothetical protein
MRKRVWLAVPIMFFVVEMVGWAQPPVTTFQTGDVFASIDNGLVLVFHRGAGADDVPDLVLNTGNQGHPTTGSAFAADGSFYVTTFTAGSVVRFPRDASTPDATFPTGGSATESIVFNASGEWLVGNGTLALPAGTTPNDDVRSFATGGAALDTFDAEPEGFFDGGDLQNPNGTDWIELAADQRTLLYTSEGRLIKRFDLQTGTQLADFVDLTGTPGRLHALRLLPDGGLLAADSVNVKRFDSSGALVQTYDIEADLILGLPYDTWFSLNLDPETGFFWTGDAQSLRIHRFAIDSDPALAYPPVVDTVDVAAAGGLNLFGVSIFGEPTQATTPSDPPDQGNTPPSCQPITPPPFMFTNNPIFTTGGTMSGGDDRGRDVFTIRGGVVDQLMGQNGPPLPVAGPCGPRGNQRFGCLDLTTGPLLSITRPRRDTIVYAFSPEGSSITITGAGGGGGPALFSTSFAPGEPVFLIRNTQTNQGSFQGNLSPGLLDPVLATALGLPSRDTVLGTLNNLFMKVKGSDPFTGLVVESDVLVVPAPGCLQ